MYGAGSNVAPRVLEIRSSKARKPNNAQALQVGPQELLDAAAKNRFGLSVRPRPIRAFSYTDARSFLARGIPAITRKHERTGRREGIDALSARARHS